MTTQACRVCSQVMEHGVCPNPLCADPSRQITRIRAIAYYSGDLATTIKRYKYQGKVGWSLLFGRLLVAWLVENGRANRPDLIVANPTFHDAGSPSSGHTERVLEAAAREDLLDEWPFDAAVPRAVVKTHATPTSAGKSATEKREAAAQLRRALRVPERARTQGRHVLVYDDICTTGHQLDAVADVLMSEGGAADVEAVVLARAPWRISA